MGESSHHNLVVLFPCSAGGTTVKMCALSLLFWLKCLFYQSCQAWRANIFSFSVWEFSHIRVQTVWMEKIEAFLEQHPDSSVRDLSYYTFSWSRNNLPHRIWVKCWLQEICGLFTRACCLCTSQRHLGHQQFILPEKDQVLMMLSVGRISGYIRLVVSMASTVSL